MNSSGVYEGSNLVKRKVTLRGKSFSFKISFLLHENVEDFKRNMQ